MRNIVIGIIAAIILIAAGAFIGLKIGKPVDLTVKDKVSRLEKLSGSQKLILAEQEVYHEYTIEAKKYANIIHAEILIRWLAKYQYLIDLQKQPLKFETSDAIVKDGVILTVTSPQIQLNDPIINLSIYKPLVLNGSFAINEQRIINGENSKLSEKSKIYGNDYMKDEKIRQLCTDQLKDFLYKLTSGLGLKVAELNVKFE